MNTGSQTRFLNPVRRHLPIDALNPAHLLLISYICSLHCHPHITVHAHKTMVNKVESTEIFAVDTHKDLKEDVFAET